MNILVTGGTGFVGSHVCRQLMAAGHAVRLLVRDLYKAQAYYRQLGEGMPELVVGDVTDIGSVKAALAGCEASCMRQRVRRYRWARWSRCLQSTSAG